MRIALLGDLHGNMVATEAVHAHIKTQSIDAIYCLGDLVGKGPRSAETMDWALEHCAVIVQGNWDGIVYRRAPNWFSDQLGDTRLEQLRALPHEHHFAFAGRKVRLVHGRHYIPTVAYSDSPLEERLALFRAEDGFIPDMVGFADIHRPFWQTVDGAGILFNTGSVGNPLGGYPESSYVILEGEMGDAFGPISYTLVQLPYDREKAVQEALNAKGLPQAEAFVNELRTGWYSR